MTNQSGQFIPVECNIFAEGDQEKSKGTLSAYISIIAPERRRSGLQPTTRYLRLVLLGAFFSSPHILSQPYIGHLVLLRPYEPSSFIKKLTRYLFGLCLIPNFLLSTILNKVGLSRLSTVVRELSWWGSNVGESIVGRIGGSGFRND